jgi:AraC-like DNA-binding protein/quercetin dioxygenase-like cupin family protein
MTVPIGSDVSIGLECQLMSHNGQSSRGAGGDVVISTFPMAQGASYLRHSHPDHQLACASNGVLSVSTDQATWVLPPTRALWIPALVPHEVTAAEGATMTAAYLRPDRCANDWNDPTPLRASELLRQLLAYLSSDALDVRCRSRAEAVLKDVLEPVPVATIELRSPTDPRAVQVADGLRASPSDKRDLSEWGNQVGASGRTLARAFRAETGMTFGRWRTMARLQAALVPLAAGEPVGNVAHAVGYETPSAFVAAFRHHTGQTPGAYFSSGTGHH